jgi:hypothetical protein
MDLIATPESGSRRTLFETGKANNCQGQAGIGRKTPVESNDSTIALFRAANVP